MEESFARCVWLHLLWWKFSDEIYTCRSYKYTFLSKDSKDCTLVENEWCNGDTLIKQIPLIWLVRAWRSLCYANLWILFILKDGTFGSGWRRWKGIVIRKHRILLDNAWKQEHPPTLHWRTKKKKKQHTFCFIYRCLHCMQISYGIKFISMNFTAVESIKVDLMKVKQSR